MLDYSMKLKETWGLLRAAGECWVAHNAARLGAALSYYTIFAISPLFVIIIFIASLWFNKSAVQTALYAQLSDLAGPQGAHAIESALSASAPHNQGLVASVLAIGTLILSATGLFLELQGDLNTIWGVEPKPTGTWSGVWSFVKNRLLSFAMVLGIGFLLLVSLVLSAVVASAAKYLSALTPGLGGMTLVMHDLLSFAVISVLFAMIFKVLPDVKIAWREVWIGAVVTAVLFTGGKVLLGLYLGRSATVSAYGAAGSVILVLLWVYYSSQILFFGAEVTQAYANQFGARLEPKENAQWVTSQQLLPRRPRAREAKRLEDEKARLVSELRDQVEEMRGIRPGGGGTRRRERHRV